MVLSAPSITANTWWDRAVPLKSTVKPFSKDIKTYSVTLILFKIISQ